MALRRASIHITPELAHDGLGLPSCITIAGVHWIEDHQSGGRGPIISLDLHVPEEHLPPIDFAHKGISRPVLRPVYGKVVGVMNTQAIILESLLPYTGPLHG